MATTVKVWEPLRDFVSLREAMDRLVEDSFIPAFKGGDVRANGSYRPAADAWESADAVVVELALPGADPNSVEVTYEQDSLTVSGTLPERDADQTWVLRERPRGGFQRRFALNTPIEVEKAEATFKDGVLTLRLPKSEATKPRKINVRMN